MTQQKRSGDSPFVFVHRGDLHVLPPAAQKFEPDLHGGFAVDRREGYGQLYYGMPGCGILRIDADLKRQELVKLPDHLEPLNFHSTRLGQVSQEWRLFLAANDGALVAAVDLEGRLDFVLSRPEFDQYHAVDVTFAPTDTLLVDDRLFVADGYGANYICSADVTLRQWSGLFGGKTADNQENGKFGTAHGINRSYTGQHLVIADRPHSRLQIHTVDGGYVKSYDLPPGSWPCGIDYVMWQGRWLAVIGSLVDPVEGRPAPIYIVDPAADYRVLSTIRPSEDLGLEQVQHLHNVVWHVWNQQLYLVCQSWNPGYYFVLELI